MFPLLLRFLEAASVVMSVLASPFYPVLHGKVDGSPLVTPAVNNLKSASVPLPHCFPALGFKKPSNVPSSVEGWWCDPATEYAFVGFSYEVTACQTPYQLQKEFADIRNRFHSRYVRLYGACDREGFYDDVIEAAWDNTLGVHALIWFGFDDTDEWVGRRNSLFRALHSNPKAKFVTRVVQFGSEPLFDGVLSPDKLEAQVLDAKKSLSGLGIPVTVSELAYGYQETPGAQIVLDAIDSINIHMLPFFAQNASTGDKAWPLVLNDLNWFIEHGKGKKMYFDEVRVYHKMHAVLPRQRLQNGWPSVTSPGVQPNSPDAIANIPSEKAYYDLLDQHCVDLKGVVGGGVGWFAHIYSDDQEPGYGIYDSAGRLKFPFAPRTSC